jgi:hypothetical protein
MHRLIWQQPTTNRNKSTREMALPGNWELPWPGQTLVGINTKGLHSRQWCPGRHPNRLLPECLRTQYGPGINSASNRNKYDGNLLGGKSGRFVGLTTLSPSCADCREILGASTSWNSQGLSRPVKGLLLPPQIQIKILTPELSNDVQLGEYVPTFRRKIVPQLPACESPFRHCAYLPNNTASESTGPQS